MLDRLLESKARRDTSPVGAATSIAAHIAVIVIAVHATAQSRPRPTNEPRLVVLPFVANPTVLPQATRTSTPPVGFLARKSFRFSPVAIDPQVPPLDFAPPSPTDPSDFRRGVMSTSNDPGAEVATNAGTFRADQVERQVTLLEGALPDYPEALRSAGIAGQVVAEFTVNERGLVETDSVRFVRSDNVLFERSVRGVLRRMRFAPAEIGGRRVRQLVQMPFVFTLSAR
jgi:protein TonB